MKALATQHATHEITQKNQQERRSRLVSPLSTGMPMLQRQCACGGGCPRCKDDLGIQTKLKISEPGDPYEQEADRIADEVMRMPEPSVQRQVKEEEEEEGMVQRKEISAPTPLNSKQSLSELPPIVHEVLNSSGQPLEPDTRTRMESHFGCNFSQVKIHTDAKAAKAAKTLGAYAFTAGHNIIFGEQQYAPWTTDGKSLLAHELVHIAQQNPRLEAQAFNTLDEREVSRVAPIEMGTIRFNIIQRQIFNKTEIERRIAEIENDLSIQSFPEEEEKKLWEERDLLYGQLQGVREERKHKKNFKRRIVEIDNELSNQSFPEEEEKQLRKERHSLEAEHKALQEESQKQKRSERMVRYIAGKSDEDIERLYADTIRQYLTEPTNWRKNLDLEILEQERNQRIQKRRSKPVTSPKTVADALFMLEEAQREDEQYESPNRTRAFELVSSVDAWLYQVAGYNNLDRHFGDLPFTDYARLFPGKAKEYVHTIKLRLKLGATIGGWWDVTINTVKATREYLEVLSEERTLKSSSIPGTHKAVAKGALYTVIGYYGLLAAIAAAPLILGEGALIAWSAQQTGRTILTWVLTKPIEAAVYAEFTAGTVLKIVDAGGISEFLQGFSTPEGFIQTIYEILTLRMAVQGGKGQSPQTVDIETEVIAIENGITLRVKQAPALPDAQVETNAQSTIPSNVLNVTSAVPRAPTQAHTDLPVPLSGNTPSTPADAARAYADRFNGRLINGFGLEGIFARTKNQPTLSVDRRAAAFELRIIDDVLTNGYNGRSVARVQVLPPTKAQRTPDLIITFADDSTTRIEGRAFTAAPRGHSRPNASLALATKERSAPLTQSELEAAIVGKAASTPTRFSQLDAPIDGVTPEGRIAISSMHRPLSITTSDAAVANVAPQLGIHVQSISLTFRDSATGSRTTLIYNRQGTTFIR